MSIVSLFRSRARLVAIAVAFAASAFATQTSRADLQLTIWQDANTPLVLTSGTSPLNFSGTDVAFPDFTFSGFSVTSNVATPASQAELKATGTISVGGLAADATLNIIVSTDGYGFPTGPNYLLGSSGSYTEALTNSDDSFYFQSGQDPGNALDTFTNASAGFTFQLGNSAGSHNETPVALVSGTPYSLSQKLVFKITSLSSGAVLQPTVSTTLVGNAVVPEPSSLILAGLGSLGLLVGAFVRKRRGR